MWLELRVVRRRYLSVVATGFVAVPMAGYGVARWLGRPDGFSLLQSRPGTLLAVFVIAWWLAAYANFRKIFSITVPRKNGEAVVPKVLSQALRQLHSHYWGWLCVYVAIASVFYAATDTPDLSAPVAAAEWAHFMLIQSVVAVLVGVPFYLSALTALGGYAAAAGLDKVHASIETRLLLSGVLVPLLAGVAMMYFYWRRTQLWTAEELLLWSGLGLLLLAAAISGLRNVFTALRPLRAILAKNGHAPRLEDIVALRPASTDEVGLLTQSLSRLGSSLAAAETRTLAVINAAPDGIVVTDAAGRIEVFNPAAERLFGYRAVEARGVAIRRLLPELTGKDGAPRCIDSVREVSGHHRSKHLIPLAVRVSKAVLDNKPFYVCLVRDIAERNETQRRLVTAEAGYRDLVESSRDLIWSIDRDGRWTFANAAAKNIYGADPAELLGRTALEFTEPQYLEREKAALKALWDGKAWLEYESVHHDRNGALHHLSFIAWARKNEQGRVTAVNGIARDVTEHKVYEQKLAYQASHDALTGLLNRNYMHQELERMVTRVARGNPGGVLLFLDLDQLKFINDALGHGVGDRLLVEAARLMKKHVREGDLLARYGGDEFTVLLYNADAEGAVKVAENLCARFGDFKFLEAGNVYPLTCSIGLVMIDDGVKSADQCLVLAERACNNAKILGRNQVVFHEPSESKPGAVQDVAWIERIRGLLEKERFQLVYQPIMAVATSSVYDYEVLLRMVEDGGHLLNPGAFLPTAERLGLSRKMDRSVVVQAVRSLAALRASGQAVRFSINLTAAALRDETLLDAICEALAEVKLDPAVLTFEITETAVVADLAAAADFILAVNEMGARVVLEHFGLGFSSFTYLKHLAVDALKIDGSYVRGLTQSIVNQVVVRSINQVAHALGKVTIAPQVENKEVLMLLRDLGVDYAQGYFVGRPEQRVGADRYIGAAMH